MRKTFLVALATLLVGGMAGPATADGVFGGGASDWGGLSIGASVGYGIADTAFRHTYEDLSIPYADTSTSDISSGGVTGTIAIGYDVTVHANVVAGIFADYTFGELEGSGVRSYPTPPTLERFSLDYDGTWAVGARVGLARAGDTLWYLAAGYTETEVTLSDARGTLEKDLKGYFLGAGVEQKIHHGLSLKLEYRFSDYGNETLYEDVATGAPACAAVCYERYDVDTHIHAVRLGVAYRFGARREAEAVPLK